MKNPKFQFAPGCGSSLPVPSGVSTLSPLSFSVLLPFPRAPFGPSVACQAVPLKIRVTFLRVVGVTSGVKESNIPLKRRFFPSSLPGSKSLPNGLYLAREHRVVSLVIRHLVR